MVTLLGVVVMLLGMLEGTAAAGNVGGAVPAVRLWQPGGIQATPAVPGKPYVAQASTPSLTPAQKTAKAKAAKPYHAAKTTWPVGTATVALAPASRSTVGAKTTGAGQQQVVPGATARAGALPVTVASDDPATGAAKSVSVTVGSRAAAAQAGVSGILLGMSRADGGSAASKVSVNINYAGFAAAYGGGWADRLRLVTLPACALTTPQLAKCRTQTPVRFSKNLAAGTLTAQVAVGAATAKNTTAQGASAAAGTAVLATATTASGSVGNYAATSLSSAGQWSAGGNSGNFTYSYPIKLPAPAGGAAPNVTLGYDSGSVDGRTSAVNSQASWIGDGWDYSPGYIERSYQGCSQDNVSSLTNSGDVCWAGNLVRLSLGPHSSTLVRDDTSGTWKPSNDDGTKVIPLTGKNNGAWNGEAWEIITSDGTQYYFGLNHLPTGSGSDAATGSTWTEPVYCPKSGDGPPGLTCYSSSSGPNSFQANMAYRWNLDYVVDPHGGLQTYSWTQETNYYQRGYGQGNGVGTNTSYTRGGYLSSISYGYQLSDAIAGTKPADVVTFNTEERCVASSCSSLTASTAANWPDVPFDQICATQSGTCSNYSPSFFSTRRLTSIVTTTRVGTAYDPVDTYTLSQMFPAPEAGVVSSTSGVTAINQGDGTAAVMWLNSIQHTGNDTLGGGSAAKLPPVTFTAMETPNRVDGAISGAAALYRPRMDYLTTESGSQIVVSYADLQCSRVNNTMPASADSDTMNCFPQYWTPTSGTGPVLDWFNKPQVTMVTVNDLVSPAAWSEAQVTKYSYQGIAWHRDDTPLTPAAQRTWNQFRGYRTVTTTTGAASALSVPTQTMTTYLQGMDGDYLSSGAKRSVSVPDSVGDTVTDSDWLNGQTLESQSLLGASGAVQRKVVNGPWTTTVTSTEAQANSMPSMVARMTATSQVHDYALWHDGSWKKTETDASYDSAGRVVTSDAKGDGTSAVPEVCTTTAYAQDTGRNMLAYPAEVKAVRGPCGTTATTANTVSDTRTFYDSSSTLGAITGAGDPTRTDAVDSYDSAGNPVYVTQKTSSYDAYGRVTSATDADGHTTQTTYTAPGASPDTVQVTNPKGWTTTSVLDPATGLAMSSRDVNDELTTQTYDGLGRLTAVWSPLHAQSAQAPADKTFAYSVTGTAPTTVSTSTLRDDGSYGTDVKIYDASNRLIQEQAPTADASVGRLLTDTHYNSLGQTVKTTAAYVEKTTSPSTTMFLAANDSVLPSESESCYDGAGRPVQTLTVAKGVNQWSSFTAYVGTDETDTTPPAGGTATSAFTDAVGRKIATWKYNTATPTGKAADAIATTYTYTPAGKPATMSNSAGDQWSYSYDLHERQTQLVDPGAGTSKSTYSPGGEVLTTTDGRNNQLTFTYDVLARKTAEYNTTGGVATAAANELVSWTYDTLANGQPTSSTRYTNGAADATHAYTEGVTGYTALYQPAGSSATIPSAEGNLAGTYQTSDAYSTTTSLLIGTHYNAEGGLPREQDNYSYTLSGLLSAFGGTYTYLNTVAYTPQGQVLQTNFGASGGQLVRTETYDQPTGRLLTVGDAVQTSTTGAVNSSSYTYNQAGNITSESTVSNGGSATDTQCFGYDNQNRLTSAWTDTAGVNSPTTGQILGIGGCADTAPVAGKVTGGPAAYWETFGYNALGDRVTETNHDTSVSSTTNDVTQTLNYNGYNASTGVSTATSQPDAVQSVTTKNSSGSTTSSYGYDNGGSALTRTGQKLTYDAEGHTATVTNTTSNTTSSYTYAADGSLLLQRDPANNQTVLYLPYGEQLQLNTGNSTVSGLRYYANSPDGVTVARSSSGTVSYELTDKLKTATTSINATTLAVTRRYFDPYGNARGTVPTAWPDQHSYLGKPQDPSTGLDLLGARNYDPVTGRFLTVDPVMEAGDNNQMNGYSYSADNPVNGSDPTGLMHDPEGGGSGSGGCSAYDYMPGGACFLGGGNSTPLPPTITITIGGTSTTVNGDDTPLSNDDPAARKYAVKNFRRQGYQGSDAFTYSEMLAWADKSEEGWVALCGFISGQGPGACQADPIDGNQDVYSKNPDRKLAKWIGVGGNIGTMAACTFGGPEGCAIAGFMSMMWNSAQAESRGESLPSIAKADLITAPIVFFMSRGIDGALDPAKELIAADETTGMIITSTKQLYALKVGLALPEDGYSYFAETKAFMEKGELDTAKPALTVMYPTP